MMSSTKVLTASLFFLGIAGTAAAQKQGYDSFRKQTAQALTNPAPTAETSGSQTTAVAKTDFYFKSKKDSLDWVKNKKLADNSKGFRILVSLQERHLWVVIDEDTLLSAPAAVASGRTVRGRCWARTPIRSGRRRDGSTSKRRRSSASRLATFHRAA